MTCKTFLSFFRPIWFLMGKQFDQLVAALRNKGPCTQFPATLSWSSESPITPTSGEPNASDLRGHPHSQGHTHSDVLAAWKPVFCLRPSDEDVKLSPLPAPCLPGCCHVCALMIMD
uniref:Uncharacterized protein n=1 Tax=Mus musculus TaxID=10090 RepID=Q3T9I3_MOUSE|nr:unnamed protein product [Mus musculus]